MVEFSLLLCASIENTRFVIVPMISVNSDHDGLFCQAICEFVTVCYIDVARKLEITLWLKTCALDCFVRVVRLLNYSVVLYVK